MAHYRDVPHDDVRRHAAAPALETRQKVVAVLATVKEKIDDFDFVAGLDRLLRNLAVIEVRLALRSRRLRKRNAGEPQDKRQRKSQARRHHLLLAGAILARLRDQLVDHLEKPVVVDAAIGIRKTRR